MSPASVPNVAPETSIPVPDEVESVQAEALEARSSLELRAARTNGASHSNDPSDSIGHALGLVDGTTLIVAEASTNAANLEIFESMLDASPNGVAIGSTNGRSNDLANGHSNGRAAVRVAGHRSGQASAHTNGHANGHANGYASGYVNRRANGHADVASILLSPPVGAGIPAPATSFAPALPGIRNDIYARIGKRAIDLVGASVAIVLLAPVVLLAALVVKITSRGPALYKSTRLGRHGKPFTFYKLRSMTIGADAERANLMHLNEADGPVFKLRQDPRVTRVGQWLRSSSIDELPQLLNVIKGDMSLVGPRPPLPDEVDKYEVWQRRRLDVKPGITCLWQISGRSRLGFEEWMRLDLEYIRRQSLATDVWILLRTVPAVLSREGAY